MTNVREPREYEVTIRVTGLLRINTTARTPEEAEEAALQILDDEGVDAAEFRLDDTTIEDVMPVDSVSTDEFYPDHS